MSRQGKTETGSHEYEVAAGITACLMGNDVWYLFKGGSKGGQELPAPDFKTLAAARKWIKANPQ